jgi:hypothetical protein
MKIVWHYTYHTLNSDSHSHFVEILRSQMLLPPCLNPTMKDDFPDTREANADARLLLFSENDYWEPASFRGFVENGQVVDLHNRADYAPRGLVICRIGVDSKILHPYLRLLRTVCMPKGMAKALISTAREHGANPYEWYGTTKPVPLAQWRAVEMLIDNKWQEPLTNVAGATTAGK